MNRAPILLGLSLLWGCGPAAPTSSTDAGSLTDATSVNDGEMDASPSSPPGWTMPERGLCEGLYGAVVDGPALGDDALVETSGLVASPSRPGILWMHNDSGDAARLYAVGTDGRARGRLTLPGEAVDWEDLAAAPCPDGSGPCLWIGDIGDNAAGRPHVSVLATPEPQTDGERRAGQVWRFPVVYPDGARDAEALVVSPAGDQFWIIEKKEEGPVRVFGHPGPLTDGVSATLEVSPPFEPPGIDLDRGRMITAADLHPSATRLLVRVYTGTYEYRFGAGQGPMDLGAITPQVVALGPLSEPQGETVAYDETGRGVVTVSEDRERQPGQPLHYYPCETP